MAMHVTTRDHTLIFQILIVGKNENLKVMVISLYRHDQPIVVVDLPFVATNRLTLIHDQMS